MSQTPSQVDIDTTPSEVVSTNQPIDDHFMQQDGLKFAGKHYIVDFWEGQFLEDAAVIETALTDAAKVCGAELLHIHLHCFSSGGGITGVALLAESHISVHTWPEHNYAAFDIFMCGKAEPHKAVDLLQAVFKPKRFEVKELLRGKLEDKA